MRAFFHLSFCPFALVTFVTCPDSEVVQQQRIPQPACRHKSRAEPESRVFIVHLSLSLDNNCPSGRGRAVKFGVAGRVCRILPMLRSSSGKRHVLLEAECLEGKESKGRRGRTLFILPQPKGNHFFVGLNATLSIDLLFKFEMCWRTDQTRERRTCYSHADGHCGAKDHFFCSSDPCATSVNGFYPTLGLPGPHHLQPHRHDRAKG